ncbi:5548_t:CDS:2 [Dentiscutata heterogama]|uniref:5548_t:CDS:1 n=1 Tax=Dentiscutata heterogama TaxID=1316150 RepID=A0ACA9P5D9_9GLOM|nr:5548_t:CDS:2 [Dentiscutata heterogama]
MGRIRKDEIPSVTLSEDDYKKYCQKLPDSLKRGLESKMVKKVEGKLIAESSSHQDQQTPNQNLIILDNESLIKEYQSSNYSESTNYTQTLVHQTPEEYISNSNQIINQTLKENYLDQTPNQHQH